MENEGLVAYDVFGITPQPQHLRLLSNVNVFGGLFSLLINTTNAGNK
jgi:hypothetical protein